MTCCGAPDGTAVVTQVWRSQRYGRRLEGSRRDRDEQKRRYRRKGQRPLVVVVLART
jgi:hypothetical protein